MKTTTCGDFRTQTSLVVGWRKSTYKKRDICNERHLSESSLSHRGDPGVIPKIESSLTDEKSAVRFTGAAAIIHLSDVEAQKPAHKRK